MGCNADSFLVSASPDVCFSSFYWRTGMNSAMVVPSGKHRIASLETDKGDYQEIG
jgi:hypothetical protein